MANKPYNAELKQKARELRKNATKQENQLWYEYLREFRPRFTRQRIVGNYILDFYCGKVKLAVELDGSQHYESDTQKYDGLRTDYLNSLGIEVIRFPNTDVNSNFEGVCITIARKVDALINSTPVSAETPPSCAKGAG